MKEKRNKVLLVGVQLQRQTDFEYGMEELANLATACDLQPVGELTQKAERLHSSYYIGRGKLQELQAMLEAHDSPAVIFNDELSPSQIRNLEAVLDCRIIDRTMLILEIFAERAQTREAQLQVEVARLQYMLPRLVGSRESLGRQGGGAGLKNRGSGETRLELDRRRIEERITMLEAELTKLAARRQQLRKQRRKNEVPVVSLVGYTNAGKSSLLNTMLERYHPGQGKQVFAHDMLFATLETKSRSIRLQGNRSIVLTDTVGFVSRLPHHLVKAFRSTLEEVAESDLLLHVVDSSHPEQQAHIQVTRETLRELGADQVQEFMVYNKADLTHESYPRIEGDAIYLSAHQAIGIDELSNILTERLFHDEVQLEILVPYDKGHIVSYFKSYAEVTSMSHEDEGTRMSVHCSPADMERYKDEIVIYDLPSQQDTATVSASD
ncbi:GTPase HflX [Paenibacillus massiliensis]|uniref:GTPase HflX n=1 Tax=Paenibacillus massiliensis TaxID=225917 RepID=UPI0004029E9B|nr:GTPase HflX [Paenibacillus massiliensis]